MASEELIEHHKSKIFKLNLEIELEGLRKRIIEIGINEKREKIDHHKGVIEEIRGNIPTFGNGVGEK